MSGDFFIIFNMKSPIYTSFYIYFSSIKWLFHTNLGIFVFSCFSCHLGVRVIVADFMRVWFSSPSCTCGCHRLGAESGCVVLIRQF